MLTVEFISGKVPDTAACKFLEKNSTAIVSPNFPIHFKQSDWNKLPFLRKMSMMGFISPINFCTKKFISAEVIEYFLQPFEKELYSNHFKGVFQRFPKALKQSKKEAASAFRAFLEKCLRWSLFLEKLQTSAETTSHPSEMYPMESFPEELQAGALYSLYKRKNFAVVVSEAATERVLWKKVSFEISHNSQ